MNLRSGKMLMHKKLSAKSNEIDQDIISKLPDEMLTQILSMLPDSDANRSRILSYRWKNLYAFLPNLHFFIPSTEQVNKSHDFIDQTLSLRGNKAIQRFILECHNDCDYNRLSNWLSNIIRCKIQQLVLIVPAVIRFNWELFKTCDTLVELKLSGRFIIDVPEDADLLFPCLKKVELVSIIYSSDESLTNLISYCRVLQELIVQRIGVPDNLDMFKVSSPSLKRLSIGFTHAYQHHNTVIDAPNLEYLCIFDENLSRVYSYTETLSLVEANISIQLIRLNRIATCLSSVKILTLTCLSIQALRNAHPHLNLPMFPNLVKLVVDRADDPRAPSELLLSLLNNMPNLEHITFSNGYLSFNSSWKLSMEPPFCLRFKIKGIVIHHGGIITQVEYKFIRYLLRKSNILETLTINASIIDPKRRERLLNIYRGSNSCQIEFI